MSGNGKEAVRLCEHIVRQAFGDVVGRVASTLLHRGRLPSPTIARLSGLPRPTTLAALIILTQHNLVQSNGASYKDIDEQEQYEFDVMECVMRLRWGRILAITHQQIDDIAYEIVRQIMIYGKLRVPEIIAACGGARDANRAVKVNETIIALVRDHFLQPTSPELVILESDQIARRFAANRRRTQRARGSAMLSANDLDNCQKEARYEVGQERDAQRDISRILIQKARVDKKKKKGKAIEEYEYELREDIHLRLNYDRYGIFIRNELIVKAAEDRWNKAAAVVMRAVLKASLKEGSSLRDDRTLDKVGLNEIVDNIPHADYPFLSAGLSASTRTSPAELVRQYLAILSGDDQLSGSGRPFLQKDNSGNNPGYQVELESICVKLRETLLSELVREKLGNKAARVLAVVVKSSRAFETTVRDCAMVPLKDARLWLSELQKLSLLETQEVPKTAAKSRMGLPPSAEYHLWSIDLARVYGILLTNVYKTLGNMIQRKAKEIDKKQIVLAREARTEGHPGGRGLLQLKDQEDLGELDDALNKLSLAEARSELVVFILRDLPGWPRQA